MGYQRGYQAKAEAVSEQEEQRNNGLEGDPISVSEAMKYAKESLEGVFVRLVGEICELSNKRGYKAVYFSVKDNESVLPCQIWINRFNKLGIELQVGQLVELTGRFTLYAPKGRMNFEVRMIELAGEGKLRMQVANLARKLKAEGLMDPQRKLAIPVYPEKIGVVTSPRGKAVHDVLRTLRTRFPLAEVKLAGITVEGPKAVDEILEGMRCMLRARVEVILLVRGGGTYEELMPFNDERLARAIAVCPVPVVTGIGHEPDNSIADMVADRRESLPALAAAAVSADQRNLFQILEARETSLKTGVNRTLDRAEAQVDRCASRPIFQDSNILFAAEAQGLDIAAEHLSRAIPANIERDRLTINLIKERLLRALPNEVAQRRLQTQRQSERLARVLPSAVAMHQVQVDRQHERLAHALPNAVASNKSALARQQERLMHALPQVVERERSQFTRDKERFARALPLVMEHVKALVSRQTERMVAQGASIVPRFAQDAQLRASRLNDLSPLGIIGRGYAIARLRDGSVVKSVSAVSVGSNVQVTVSDGVLDCTVDRTEHIDSEFITLKDVTNGTNE